VTHRLGVIGLEEAPPLLRRDRRGPKGRFTWPDHEGMLEPKSRRRWLMSRRPDPGRSHSEREFGGSDQLCALIFV